MNRQEATTGIQKAEIQCLQRDLESTQDSLNNWDDGILETIQRVHVDDSIGTSISSVRRETEPAISDPPQAGCEPGAVQTERAFCAKRSTKMGCSSEYITGEQFESPTGRTQCIHSYDDFAD